MSLSIEPKHGIRLQLARYSPIRSWQGGGKFWEHDHQLTIRQGKLAGFLPRALEEDNSIRYEQIIDGREAASESVPLNRMEEVPAGQIEALRAALHELKSKGDDPLCDDTKRRIIEAFRLPDPVKDPELYRLHGKGQDRRLLVLWGVEKEAGSALVPLQALAGVSQQAPNGGGKSRSLLWLWVLLAVLLVAALLWWMLHRPSRTEEVYDSQPAQDVSVPGAAPGTTAPPVPPPLTSTQPGTEPSSPRLVPDEGNTAAPGTGSGSPTATDRSSSAPSSASNGSFAPPVSSGARPPNQDTAPGDLAASTSSPASATTSGNPAPSGRSSFASPAPFRTGTAPAVSPSAGRNRPQEPSRANDQAAAPNNPPTDPTTDASISTPSITPAESTTSSASRMTSLEIVSARSGTAPKNGRVEVLFNVLAHDAEGLSPDVPKIVAWTIDNEVQKGKDGKPVANAALPVALTKGTHWVSLSATTPDGRPIKAQADVEIDVKVTEESSVKVRAAGQ